MLRQGDRRSNGRLQPSGEVVAIVQRPAQDLVVCLSQRDEAALLSNPDSLRSVRPQPRAIMRMNESRMMVP